MKYINGIDDFDDPRAENVIGHFRLSLTDIINFHPASVFLLHDHRPDVALKRRLALASSSVVLYQLDCSGSIYIPSHNVYTEYVDGAADTADMLCALLDYNANPLH